MTENTRQAILTSIRTKGRISVNEIAETVGISPVSVRHHLSSLAADQLIQYEEVRQGVGRPLKLYSLTERAFEQTPGHYLSLTNRILDRMKNNLSTTEMLELFEDIAEGMTSELKPDFNDLPLNEKLSVISEFLCKEGFSVEIEQQDNTITFHELTCPYFHISREHPEVCAISKIFISNALGVPAQRKQWLLQGDAHCSFSFDTSGISKSDRQEDSSRPITLSLSKQEG